ncbi:MAG: ATP-binding protein [Syntrophorhabdaceae bacterium]|nr:ATP-binding protein [Syntrophorhabdaceae bacterium]
MINIRNLSVGTRLGVGFGVLVATILFVVVMALMNMQFSIKRLSNIIENNNRKVAYANTIDHAVHIMNDAVNNILQSRSSQQWDLENIRLLTAQAMYDNALSEIEKLEQNEKGEKIIYSLKTLSAYIKQQITDITILHFEKRYALALKEYQHSYRPSIKHIQQLCQELVAYQDEASSVEYFNALKKYKMTLYVFCVLALCSFIFSIFTAIILTRSIKKPLEQAVDAAKKLSEGDYHITMDIKGNDEPGRLLMAMKELAEKLKKAKETEQQLYESQKMETLGRLAGGIAHDFNNMLSIILGNTQLIKMNASSFDEKTHKRCNAIENAVARASGFVKQLLVFSKKQPLVLEKANINKAITELYKLLQKMIGEDIEIKLNLDPMLPEVNIDVTQFNQVLLNLIVNARESMPEGGTITIWTHKEEVVVNNGNLGANRISGKYIVLSVKDTGIGIDRAIQDKIFEPFFTTKQNGTGLGLSVVYGIVKQHGGFIKLESEKGKGSVFHIYIPCVDRIIEAKSKEEQQESQGKNVLGTENILIIEDDEEIRNLIREMLSTQGYNTIVANDGLRGIEVFLKNKDDIDLVILDCIMPKMNGNKVFAEIRMHRQDIPVIFLTGNNPEKIRYSPDDDKNMIIVQKPCSLEMLSTKIREMLDSSYAFKKGPLDENTKIYKKGPSVFNLRA